MGDASGDRPIVPASAEINCIQGLTNPNERGPDGRGRWDWRIPQRLIDSTMGIAMTGYNQIALNRMGDVPGIGQEGIDWEWVQSQHPIPEV